MHEKSGQTPEHFYMTLYKRNMHRKSVSHKLCIKVWSTQKKSLMLIFFFFFFFLTQHTNEAPKTNIYICTYKTELYRWRSLLILRQENGGQWADAYVTCQSVAYVPHCIQWQNMYNIHTRVRRRLNRWTE